MCRIPSAQVGGVRWNGVRWNDFDQMAFNETVFNKTAFDEAVFSEMSGPRLDTRDKPAATRQCDEMKITP